jgi:putative molybdopterin biosynthesis protein
MAQGSQTQFLEVLDRDEAWRRFWTALQPHRLGEETVPLEQALGRVLAEDVVAQVNVPAFDRSNYDGYAVRAADTYGAQEEHPRRLRLLPDVLACGVLPRRELTPATAVAIATGGMLPRGADAVVMVEHTEVEHAGEVAAESALEREGGTRRPSPPSQRPNGEEKVLLITKPVTPGFGVSFAGTDISQGETVLRRGTVLTSRETGVLAAVGTAIVSVWRRPRVAIISTGDELIPPGKPLRPPLVYDSNARIIADAVRELGGEPFQLGIVPDDSDKLRSRLRAALAWSDVVLLSGGTSKGTGDLCYQVVRELRNPGIVAHGVALKPGKPLCLAVESGKAVVVLPGFPTSAIFTFHEFVAPVIRALAGYRPPGTPEDHATLSARLAVKVNSEAGRTEYLLVNLVPADRESRREWRAYPLGQGSGSVTTFSRADGFIIIPRHQEIVPADSEVSVHLLGGKLQAADLTVIGSHCVGLDFLLGELHDQGFHTKCLAVGSTAGLEAARREECDLAGIHLLDPATGEYNRPFLTPELELLPGYGRLQGIVFRPDDSRFAGLTAEEALARATADPHCLMVNRNQGSGTRILIDRLLAGVQPPGYAVQPRNHHAVAAAVAQGRADWGVAIEWVARQAGLGFLPLTEERYDFVAPKSRRQRPAVVAFATLLATPAIRNWLRQMGFRPE